MRTAVGIHDRGGLTAVLIATKLEAFANRGRDDYIASRDFADIVSLLDGRAELVEEISTAPDEVRRYLESELPRHREHPHFLDGIYAGLAPDAASQARAEGIVLPRLAAITAAS